MLTTRALYPHVLGKWVISHMQFRMGFEVMVPHGSRCEILITRALYPPILVKCVIYDIQLRNGLEVMAYNDLDMRY